MKIKIWGARGSIPTPTSSKEIEEKIFQAIYGMPAVDTDNPDAVRAYIADLPPFVRGTVSGNTTCVEIQAGDETFIIDAGSGIRNLGLELMKGPCGQGQGKLHIFISHLHWDHLQGFPFFLPAYLPGNQIIFYSLHDVASALMTQQHYPFFPVAIHAEHAEREWQQVESSLRQRYGYLPHMQAQHEFHRLQEGVSFSVGPLTINTLLNHHPGDAFSFRFEDQHSVFVYASDAEYKDLDDQVMTTRLNFFRYADALLFDAQYGLRETWESKVDYGHSSAMIGVDLARRAGIKRLLLAHYEPTYTDKQLQEVQETAVTYQSQDNSLPTCEVSLAYEGLELDLAPAGAIAVAHNEQWDTTILTPANIVNEQGINQLIEQLRAITTVESPTRSIVDLSQVEYLTTAGLKALVTFNQQREAEPVVLAAPSPTVTEVIRLSGYENYFALYPSVSQAIQAVQARQALNLPEQTINGQYQIIGSLGQGHLGIILKVIDRQDERSKALRILPPTFGEKSLDRLASQTQLLSKLDHRHIAHIYDFARSHDSHHTFIVEELLSGATLFEWLVGRDKAVPTEEALTIALELATALEYAHSRGVVHGNLKPQDIVLTEKGIKICGFGLARLEEGQNLLEAPVLLLNANCLAPEQILGQPLDARSDLYALGIILYQLFTGQLPFTRSQAFDKSLASDDSALLQAHLAHEPVPPRQLVAHLSPALNHLILKLLAKSPNGRYATAQQIGRILRNLISSTGETTRPVSAYAGMALVGRERQMRTLQAGWAEVRASRGQLAFISGEPGIGKTSLARQMAQSEMSVVLSGQCREEEGGQPYHPFSQALKAYFTTVPPELFDEGARQLMSHFTWLVPELRQIIPDLPEPAQLEPHQEQMRLMTSLTQFIKRATQLRPWLLILDDLQWVDESSLELLRYLGHHLPQMSLFIIGIYRDTEVGRTHRLQAALRDLSRTPTYRHLPLDRLSQRDISGLLGSVWAPPVPELLVERIWQQTEGNPLYVEEVARGLEDDGLVTVQDGRWHFPEVAAIRLPQSVYEAVEGRIHYLDADTRDVLSQAAVLGQIFHLSDLVTMSDLSQWEVLEHLDVALERQLIQEIPGDDSLCFTHTQIHHVVYNDLGTLRRRRLHRRAGQALESRPQPELERLVDELATHFTEAHETEKALVYSFQAARRAKATYANNNALQWYNRMLRMMRQLPPKQASSFARLRLLAHENIAQVLILRGRYEEALEQYDAARRLLEAKILSSRTAPRLAALCDSIASVHELQSNYETALEWLARGQAYLDPNEPILETAHLYKTRAMLYHRQGKHEEAIRECQQSLAIAAKISSYAAQKVVAWVQRILGIVYLRHGDLSLAAQHSRNSIEIYQSLDDPAGLARAYNNLGIVYINQGEWEEARDAYGKSLKTFQAIGDIMGQGTIVANLAEISLLRGDSKEALRQYKESQATWQQTGNLMYEAMALSKLATVYMRQESWAEARQALQQSEAIINEVGSKEILPEVQRHWSELLLKQGQPGEALATINKAIDLAIELHSPLEEGRSRRVLGQVHQERKEANLAESELRYSLHILSGLNSKYEVAKSRMALASFLLANRRVDGEQPAEATDLLSEALTTFEQLGAKADLVQAQTLARQTK
jgi:anti-anti-sigma factor